MEKGFVQVYTGNGKGKTTASMGLVLRALGAGFTVCFCQFVKKGNYSEIKALNQLAETAFPGKLAVHQFGIIRKVTSPFTDEDKTAAEEGMRTAEKLIASGTYNLIILDELNIALHYKLVSKKDVLKLMVDKPSSLELVITGRYADIEVMEAADLVTVMEEKKHYAKNGIPARIGIEM